MSPTVRLGVDGGDNIKVYLKVKRMGLRAMY